MNISEGFIRRPVMTILVMAAFLIFGAISYTRLPVSELPAVDFPTISVSAKLPGADPETMSSSVATPLENQFSSVPGLDSMTSVSAQGLTRITLQFALDRNIDAAAQDVQAAIAATGRDLPSTMPGPPTLRKVNPADSPVLYVAVSSKVLPIALVDEYAESDLGRRLSTLNGVAQVNVFGSQKYAVRLQLDPDALVARGIGINEAISAAQSANVNLPTGTLEGTTREKVIHSTGQLYNADAFGKQIVVWRNGSPVRFNDIGRVVNSVENLLVGSRINGDPTVILAIQRQPGANTIEVVNAIKKVLPTFQATLPPTIDMRILYDRTVSIKAGVDDVQFTLLLSAGLVILVIFLFLRNLSATLIPSLALPIAVVGTFAGMAAFGYSLDNLSLMALTLSVGFVVDDAIVMLENIVRHVEEGEEPFAAALKGSREIGFTILSMTVSLSAVFIPLLFMGGIVGRLLHEFAVTIVLAIIVSGVVSVTLTPMLCARVLRDSHKEKHGWLYRVLGNGFDAVEHAYERSLKVAVRHHWVVFVVFLATVGVSGYLFVIVPKDFLPSQDTGQIIAFTEGVNGISFADMSAHQKRVTDILAQDPNIEAVMSSVGAGGPRTTSNSGLMLMRLKPREQRTMSADQIIASLRPKLAGIPGINVFMQNPPAIRIGGNISKAQYQYTMQAIDLKTLYDFSDALKVGLAKAPGFLDVTTDLDRSTPAVLVDIDRDRAAQAGVTAAQIQQALGAAFGGQQISTIYTATNQYMVQIEIDPTKQMRATDLSRLYIRSNNGTLVPLAAVTKIGSGTVPLTVNHLGLLPAVTVSFNLASGVPLSEAVSGLKAVEQQIGVPVGVLGSFQGSAQAFQSSLSGLGALLLVAILVVYIVLGILYESFIHPLTILTGLPSAAVGALATLLYFKIPLSLYGFVGIIMLIGIVKKNAIMMIDFALERERGEGMAPAEAILKAAVIRFRPIMMTTMAALMGTLPIAMGSGAGSEARQPLGLAVVGGLMVSQVLTLYITPVLYIYLDRLGGVFKKRKAIPTPVLEAAE